MIFAAAIKEPTIFLMLTEEDIQKMRGGRTQFVDERATGGVSFNKVILSYHRTQEDALAVLSQGRQKFEASQLSTHNPKEDEAACERCSNLVHWSRLFEGKCIFCWAEAAKKLIKESN